MFIDIPFLNSTKWAIVAEANLRCGDFLSEKNCRHTLVVSTRFWSWLLNVFSFDIFELYSDAFLGFYCIEKMLKAHESTKFSILDLKVLKYAFFVFFLDAIFCGINFFSFFRTLCG